MTGDKAAKAEVETQATTTNKETQEATATAASHGPVTRRERKKADFFTPDDHLTRNDKLVIKEGKGTKLRDIPNVNFHLSKLKGSDELLEDFHNVLYGRKGKATTRKKDILEFSGFVYDADKDKEVERQEERLSRWKVEHLNRLLDALDLPRGSGKDEGSKEAKVKRALEFLAAPQRVSDKDLAAKDAEKKEKARAKREKAEAGRAKAAAAQEKAAKKKDKEQAKASPAKAGKRKAAEPKAKPVTKKAKGKKAEAEDEDEEMADVGGEEEAPAGKAAPALPSDEDVEAATIEILKDVDVQEFNLTKLMASLKDKFKVDLKAKKPLIKVTAIKYCNENGPREDDEEGEKEAEAGKDAAAANGDADKAAGADNDADNDADTDKNADKATDEPDTKPVAGEGTGEAADDAQDAAPAEPAADAEAKDEGKDDTK